VPIHASVSWLYVLLVLAAVVGVFYAILVDSDSLRRSSRR
jgi:hypothetical protein